MPRFLCAALIAAASISTAPALAQDSYPNRPIKIVLPLPPGSALDIATRANRRAALAQMGAAGSD